MRNALAACVAGAALLSALPAGAALTLTTTYLNPPSDGPLFWDTATNLEWTMGPTGASGGFEGFRLATSSEVATLFIGAGLTSFSGSVEKPSLSDPSGIPVAVNILEGLWHPGVVTSLGPYHVQFFMVADHPAAPPGSFTLGSMLLATGADRTLWSMSPFSLWASEPYLPVPLESIGRALVREHVAVAAIPEPSTYALMLMGLIGVAAWQRRAKPVPSHCGA